MMSALDAMKPALRTVSLLACVLATIAAPIAARAQPAVSRLGGSFIQYADEMQGWAPATWEGVLDQMRDLRMNVIILQMLARENRDSSTHWFIGAPGQNDPTGSILDYADRNGFRVFLGLYLPQWRGSMTESDFLDRLQAQCATVATQAWNRYLASASHPSFAGWYIPLETWTADYGPEEISRLRSFFRGVDAACQSVAGERPIAISPFISQARPPPCRVQQTYSQILSGSGIDIVLLQDSVGAQGWDSGIREHAAPYFQAFRSACKTSGARLWANLESFRIAGGKFEPCTPDRFRAQFDAAGPFVEEFVTFDFVHYMNTAASLSGWSPSRKDAMRALQEGYAANFVAVDYAPLARPDLEAREEAERVVFHWNASPGDRFHLQYKTNLTSTMWLTVQMFHATNVAPLQAILDPAVGSPRGFYRLLRFPAIQLPDSMVWVPPGSFQMGTPPEDASATADELPAFPVTRTYGYWIARHETTQSEYQNLMCGHLSAFPGDLERPVESVSWYDAMNYCVKLTAQERLAGRLPDGCVYRLPTEAEWECAARAGTTGPFPFDEGIAPLGLFAWHSPNSGGQPHPVEGLAANPWGLKDTCGNVFEWCLDWLSPDLVPSAIDPVGPRTGPWRAIRGGAWSSSRETCRSSWRIGYAPGRGHPDTGFRVVLAPELP